MPQQVGTINLEAHALIDWSYEFPATLDDNGNLITSAWAARMQVRDSFKVLQAEAFVAIGNDGKPLAIIARDVLLKSSQYFYDLILESPSGVRSKRYSGTMQILDTVTDWSLAPSLLPVFQRNPIFGGGEFIARFSYGDSTPKLLNIPITGLVDRVLIGIDVPFNSPSTLSIGTTANPSLLMSASQNAPTEVGQFESNPSVELINKQLILTITPGIGISQGSGFVVVEYSIP